MAASESTVKQRITEVLNACAPGTFSSTIDTNNKDRVADAITEAVREGALMIGAAILANPKHIHRNLYIGSATALTHGDELPDMAGEGDLIEIEKYSGAGYTVGTPKDVQKIESYRTNPNNLYSTMSHTTSGSPLSGFYAVAKGRVYFTGYACQGFFPALSRSTAASLVPDEYEGVWVAIGVELSMKEGDNLLPVAQHYSRFGSGQLPNIERMSNLADIPSPQQAARALRGNA